MHFHFWKLTKSNTWLPKHMYCDEIIVRFLHTVKWGKVRKCYYEDDQSKLKPQNSELKLGLSLIGPISCGKRDQPYIP